MTSTPFVDAIVGAADWEDRFSEFLHVGAQVGLYLGGRLRLAARLALPTDHAHDEYYDANYSYSFTRAKDYSVVYGASAGIVAVSTSSFALSPGVLFARTDVSDYGSMLGLSVPFEWVLGSGVRVGFEVALGRAFGGEVGAACSSNVCSETPSRERPSGTAFWMHFQFGYGFNHPAPLPVARPPFPAAGPALPPSR